MPQPLVFALYLLFLHTAVSQYTEERLDLQAYQDQAKCFPLQEKWYNVYRNFEYDPNFGGTAKCVAFEEIGPYENFTALCQSTYLPNQKGEAVLHLESTPGFTAKNLLHLTPVGSNESFYLLLLYSECSSCHIYRHPYIDNGAGCSYWRAESVLNEEDPCCEFIFDFYCGPGPKYYISDGCPSQN
ncbi:uncharacterized protein LOC144141526 [Haemaphysalis longicornis]